MWMLSAPRCAVGIGAASRDLWIDCVAYPAWLELCCLCGGFDRQAGQPPFEHTVGEAYGAAATVGEQSHRVIREHAVGTATVGDDGLVGGQLVQVLGEFLERDRHCTGNVSGGEFLWRPHID